MTCWTNEGPDIGGMVGATGGFVGASTSGGVLGAGTGGGVGTETREGVIEGASEGLGTETGGGRKLEGWSSGNLWGLERMDLSELLLVVMEERSQEDWWGSELSVQEELAELRKRNLTKKNAENLKDAKGLSTPEQEENQIKEKLAKTKVGVYAKEAQSNLEKGTSALDQTTDFRIKTGAAKKSDKEKQKEAAKNLQSFNQAKSNMTAKEENAPVVEDDDDVPELEEVDDVPGLEEIPDMEGGLPPGVDPDVMAAAAGENRINRAERKARRMMEKLGMKKVPGINQCTIKMGGRQGIFTIAKPDVFEKNGSYVVFGEARQGGGGLPGANAAAAASMQEQQAQAAQQLAAQADAAADDAGVPKIEEVEEEAIDDSGVDAKDIDLVMGQAGCSRAKAVKALKDNGGDLVNAIMSLTA
ncbi:NAC domain containing protein [Nitzschia inconspicua]|uniref:NAC domain containing protein n=1 Tax=Nitzschia inconspicua TaxID=303405 RepID=A0A9K3PT30_9STRA|nr:NAC domain containing protein [Nitzschia inconspicua]